MSSNHERDPLIPKATNANARAVVAPVYSGKQSDKPLGPLDISHRQRMTILSGVWIATFLTVSRVLSPMSFTCHSCRGLFFYSSSTVSTCPLMCYNRNVLAHVTKLSPVRTATQVATLLSGISSEFESSNQASWIGTAYLLATCTFTPLYGRLCNVMGRRNANQLAVVLTAAGTLGCGMATSLKMLIAARFVRRTPSAFEISSY